MTAQAPEVTGIRARTVAPLPGLRGSATPQPSGERSPSRVRAGKSVAGVELQQPRRGRGEGSTAGGEGPERPRPPPSAPVLRSCLPRTPAPTRTLSGCQLRAWGAARAPPPPPLSLGQRRQRDAWGGDRAKRSRQQHVTGHCAVAVAALSPRGPRAGATCSLPDISPSSAEKFIPVLM